MMSCWVSLQGAHASESTPTRIEPKPNMPMKKVGTEALSCTVTVLGPVLGLQPEY